MFNWLLQQRSNLISRLAQLFLSKTMKLIQLRKFINYWKLQLLLWPTETTKEKLTVLYMLMMDSNTHHNMSTIKFLYNLRHFKRDLLKANMQQANIDSIDLQFWMQMTFLIQTSLVTSHQCLTSSKWKSNMIQPRNHCTWASLEILFISMTLDKLTSVLQKRKISICASQILTITNSKMVNQLT